MTHDAPSASQTSQSRSYTDDKDFRDAVLNSTNFYRNQHNASTLGWNSSLASFASNVANKCIFKHSGGAFGENLASGYLNVTASIEGWGNERSKYDFSDPHFGEKTGHFTQLVWKATTSLGCGRQECGQAGERNQAKGTAPGWFLVCEYWPRGNVNSKEQFSQNVQKQVSRESAAAKPAVGWMLALMIFGATVALIR
ncbi:MAG: hypothetical protein Q9167_006587 [Letrouitia subvulpina]